MYKYIQLSELKFRERERERIPNIYKLINADWEWEFECKILNRLGAISFEVYFRFII